MDEALVRLLRAILLTLLTFAAALLLRLVGVFGFLVVLRVEVFRLAGVALRRAAGAAFRVARGTVRLAAFTALAVRALFVLIPGSDLVSGSRILSDACHITGLGRLPQCETALARLGRTPAVHQPPSRNPVRAREL
jgi:hypothetical protein